MHSDPCHGNRKRRAPLHISGCAISAGAAGLLAGCAGCLRHTEPEAGIGDRLCPGPCANPGDARPRIGAADGQFGMPRGGCRTGSAGRWTRDPGQGCVGCGLPEVRGGRTGSRTRIVTERLEAMIARWHKVLFLLMLVACVIMAAFLIRLRNRAQDRLHAEATAAPAEITEGPAAAPHRVTLYVPNDLDASMTTVQRNIA